MARYKYTAPSSTLHRSTTMATTPAATPVDSTMETIATVEAMLSNVTDYIVPSQAAIEDYNSQLNLDAAKKLLQDTITKLGHPTRSTIFRAKLEEIIKREAIMEHEMVIRERRIQELRLRLLESAVEQQENDRKLKHLLLRYLKATTILDDPIVEQTIGQTETANIQQIIDVIDLCDIPEETITEMPYRELDHPGKDKEI